MEKYLEDWLDGYSKDFEVASLQDHTHNCQHENEKMWQGDGFVYVTCKDCGIDL
jgi:hypothetical protein